MRRAALAVMASGLAFGMNGGPATAGASRTQTIGYGGYEITVPASWPVYRLDTDPYRCVRYDVSAVYLGTPGADQQCPPGLVGRTETVSIQIPASRPAVHGGARARSLLSVGASVMTDQVEHQFHLTLSNVVVSATYGRNPGVVRTALASLRQARGETPKGAAHGSPARGSVAPRLAASGPDVPGPGAPGPDAAGSDAAGLDAAGPGAAGSDAAGPGAAGSDAAGPDAAGPGAAGSDAAGPDGPGPGAAGPDAAGPGGPGPWGPGPGAPGGTTSQEASPVDGYTPGVQLNGGPMGGVYPGAAPAGKHRKAARQRGLAAFDTCTAPSLHAMQVWRKRYAATGIYIGGSNMACDYGNLNQAWVQKVTTKMRWSLLPLYVGPQAPCYGAGDMIDPKQAGAEGQEAATDAVVQAESLGLSQGSPIYYDMEAFDETDRGCMAAVLGFLNAWTQTLNDQGYLSGVYSSVDSGVQDLKSAAADGSFAEPQALWFAQWDGHRTLNATPGLGNSPWPVTARTKQYAGPHSQTIGGVTLEIDSDLMGGPLANNRSG